MEIMEVMTSDSPGNETSFSFEWYKQGRINLTTKSVRSSESGYQNWQSYVNLTLSVMTFTISRLKGTSYGARTRSL